MFGLDYSWGVNTQSSLLYFFSSNKYGLTTYFMRDTLLGLGDMVVKKRKKSSYLLEFTYD